MLWRNHFNLAAAIKMRYLVFAKINASMFNRAKCEIAIKNTAWHGPHR